MRPASLLPLLLAFGVARAAPAATAQWQPLELFKEQFIGSGFFVAFMPASPAQWVRVEISDDLNTWSERAEILTTRQTHLFGDGEAISRPRHFYRTVAPGTSIQEAKSRWEAMGISDYRFHFQIAPMVGTLKGGTITVTHGQKSVTDVQDLITKQPLNDFNPDDFPDIEQLFDMIANATAPGNSVDCQITYDEATKFPAVTAFTVGNLDWRVYDVLNFEVLPPN